MIVPMKKVTLLALGTEQDEALTALRGLGVMQVETIRSSASENAQQLAEELSEATRITGELEKLVQENGGEIPPGKPRSGAEALEEAADLLDKRERFAGELENIRQRQMEGIAAARLRGVQFGRPRKRVPEDFGRMKAEWENKKVSSREAAGRLGIAQDTFLRWAHGK